jgi:hypothetical protein
MLQLMRCIWEGNMTNLRHVVEFKLMLENTHTWATRVFKPLIGIYIHQWKLETRRTDDRAISVASTPAQRDLDVSRRLTPRVESILQRYATTAISPDQPSRATSTLVGIQQLLEAERERTNILIDSMFAERMDGLNVDSRRLQARASTVDSFIYTRTRRIHGRRSDLDEILPTTELNDGEYHEDEFLSSDYLEDSQDSTNLGYIKEESEY